MALEGAAVAIEALAGARGVEPGQVFAGILHAGSETSGGDWSCTRAQEGSDKGDEGGGGRGLDGGDVRAERATLLG